ncbi:MAG: FAD-dependent oxidoreductase [Clostridiales bacterium]|nr:FAD-dependent oxidoreductase [Clostridiales bacterium]
MPLQNTSLWQKISLPEFPALEKDLRTEAAVIGGGMAGLLTALRLQKSGIKTVVLEASRIASGQTGRTTAKITSQHGIKYTTLVKNLGREKAGQYAAANEFAINEYAALIEEKSIGCDFRRLPAYLYSRVSPDPLEEEAETAAKLGIGSRFVRATGLPFHTSGAVRFENQAQFHPLKFISGILDGLEIYENTRVLEADGSRLSTSGGTVTAEHIVFATHFPFINVPGWYFMRMHQERSYVVALESSWLPDGIYYSDDSDGLSFREANGLLLAGGGNHRTGENSAGKRWDEILQKCGELLPPHTEVMRWSAQDCMTLDGVPYIGRFAPSTENYYVATGFEKWGMASSMISAVIISGLILGRSPEWAGVFSPERFDLSASAAALATETAQSVRGLVRGMLAVPKERLEKIAPGRGGIVEYDGEKAGVYRSPDGEYHIVSARCPHLGCQLEWNPDEKSWDCPCHGSRFDFEGNLLDNPAQEGL